MFTQPPPPIIAVGVELLNDDEGNIVYDSKSEEEDDNVNGKSSVHGNNIQPNNDENNVTIEEGQVDAQLNKDYKAVDIIDEVVLIEESF